MKTRIDLFRSCLCVAILTLGSACVLAADRVPVTSVKPLLATAIDRGEAHGELVGTAADFMHTRFGSPSPIEIDVRALQSLPQPGCKRLEVTTRQNGVRETPKQALARKELVYQVSYCRDGSFPSQK